MKMLKKKLRKMVRKKKVKIFIPVLLLIFLVVSAFSYDVNSFYTKGVVKFSLDRSVYNVGDTINFNISVLNPNNFVIPDGYIVIDIVKGGKYYYPSQLYNNDSILNESKILVKIAPNSWKNLNFKYKIPSYYPSGEYRVDVYFRTYLSPIVGLPHIFESPISKNIVIKGSSTPLPYIVRTMSEVASGRGPVGLPINESTIYGKVCFNSSQNLNNYIFRYGVARWDDSIRKIINGGSFFVNLTKGITCKDFYIKGNFPPGAYAVRFELFNNKNQLVSFYRNRFISTGATATLRKLVGFLPYYKKGDLLNITAVVGPSPDHYTFPVTKNVNLKIEIRNISNNGLIYAFKKNIGDISANTGLTIVNFYTKVKKLIKNYQVCAFVYSGNKLFDHYCFKVYLNDYITNRLKNDISVSYFFRNGTSFINVTSIFPTKVNLQLFYNDYLLFNKDIVLNNSFTQLALRDNVTYRYYITNLKTGKQYRGLLKVLPKNNEKSVKVSTVTSEKKGLDNKVLLYSLITLFIVIGAIVLIIIIFVEKGGKEK